MASRPPEFTPTPPTAQERNRFFVLNAMRLSGVAFVLFGILVLNGKVGLAPGAGWVFLVVGLLDVFVVPQVLARKWRTPKS
jgi:hypothetical protein